MCVGHCVGRTTDLQDYRIIPAGCCQDAKGFEENKKAMAFHNLSNSSGFYY